MNDQKEGTVTLKDFEIRYKNIKKKYPDIETCGVMGCKNPVDITEGLGQDTSCSYHRFLFDFWTCDVLRASKEARARFLSGLMRLAKKSAIR